MNALLLFRHQNETHLKSHSKCVFARYCQLPRRVFKILCDSLLISSCLFRIYCRVTANTCVSDSMLTNTLFEGVGMLLAVRMEDRVMDHTCIDIGIDCYDDTGYSLRRALELNRRRVSEKCYRKENISSSRQISTY